MRRFTQKGRVVYDRPKHLFNVRDVLRIGRKIGSYVFLYSGGSFVSLLQGFQDAAVGGSGTPDFGEGTFGGGGTTRPFGKNVESPEGALSGRVIIIVEKS